MGWSCGDSRRAAHRVTRASKGFAGGEAHSVVEPPSVLYRGGGEKRSLWASSSAGSARTMFASGAHCIVKPPSVLYRGGGEKRLQLRAFGTRAWCGPGVTFGSECEDEWGGGDRAGWWGLARFTDSCFSVGFAIQAPPPFPGGGEHGGARFFLPACWLAGRLVPAPSSAGSLLLLAAAAAMAVVVVLLSCLLVVLAGWRDDGGRTRECYMRMRGGRRRGRCGGVSRWGCLCP